MLDELILDMRKHDRVEMSYKSGVSIHTINKILSGRMINPTIKTVGALRKFCDEKENGK